MYKQCLLQWGAHRTISWLPASFAKKGKLLDLKHGGKWTGPWEVAEVYDSALPEAYIREHERDHLEPSSTGKKN